MRKIGIRVRDFEPAGMTITVCYINRKNNNEVDINLSSLCIQNVIKWQYS